MTDFHILLSSLPAELESDCFLTSDLNWQLANIRDISIKTGKIENIKQIINIYFNSKARSWQISIVFNIINHK